MFIKDFVTGGKKQTITDEGYLIIKDARIARSGIQDYLAIEMGEMFKDREPGSVIRVYRPADEVFSADSIASFEQQPITNDHPAEGVDVKNFKGLSVGTAFNVRQDGIYLLADLKITDADAINDIKAGKRELSNGYSSAITRESGITPDGKTYDAIQRSIRGNHIAIVDKARCGSRCSINDSKTKKGKKVMKIIIDGVPFEVSDESLAAAIQKVIAKGTELATSQTTLQATHDAAMASAKSSSKDKEDELEEELNKAKDNAMTPEKLDAIIDERIAIISKADKLVKDFDAKGKTCLDIKREVVLARVSDISDKNIKNDVYINACFDTLSVGEGTKKTGTEKLISDSAKHTDHTDDTPAGDVAHRRHIIGNKISPKFSVGVRDARHVQHQAFNDAVDKEYDKQYGNA